MEFKVRCYHSDSNENVIGVEVVAYDGDDEIDKIILVSSDQLTELISRLDNLDSTYVKPRDLLDILSNTEQKTDINAKTLNGFASDEFLKDSDRTTRVFKPDAHADTTGEYGKATTTNYGHAKVIDNVNEGVYRAGEALAAHQGYELNREITSLKDSSLKSSLRVLVGKYSQMENPATNGEYGTRIQLPSSGDGIYVRALCDLPDFDYTKLTIYIDFNNVSYMFKSSNSQTTRKIYPEDDGTAVTSKLAVEQQVGLNFIVSIFATYAGNVVYPATAIKRVEIVQ